MDFKHLFEIIRAYLRPHCYLVTSDLTAFSMVALCALVTWVAGFGLYGFLLLSPVYHGAAFAAHVYCLRRKNYLGAVPFPDNLLPTMRITVGRAPADWWWPNYLVRMKWEVGYHKANELEDDLSAQTTHYLRYTDDDGIVFCFRHQRDMLWFKIAFHEFIDRWEPIGLRER